MKNFFQRPTSVEYKKLFVPVIESKMNINNLDKMTKQQVLDLYEPKNEKDFLAYRFDMLRRWMKNNKQYSKNYVVELEDMIDKLYLSNELNSFEQQYIKNVEAIVFAKNRNLKQLIVDFSINKNELVFYRYDLNAFKQIDQEGNAQIIRKPEMYITTQRIIISKQLDIISIYYKTMKSYQYLKYKLSINLKSGRQCFIDSDNNREIMESLGRVLKRSKIKFN
ncbi:MAG: hypothetical protein ACOQNV_01990 [Mycoplasmoidaceae bacterium]